MQNTSRMENNKNSKVIFDLKGSSINRMSKLPKKDQKFWRRYLNCSKILKDTNFIEINKELNYSLLRLDALQYQELLSIIKIDSAFLRHQGFMDYSLLLTIE
jgi:hypothetical protein